MDFNLYSLSCFVFSNSPCQARIVAFTPFSSYILANYFQRIRQLLPLQHSEVGWTTQPPYFEFAFLYEGENFPLKWKLKDLYVLELWGLVQYAFEKSL